MRLYGVGVDARRCWPAQEIDDILRQARVESRRGDLKAHAFPFADRIDRQPAAAWNGLLRNDKHVEQQLDSVLRQEEARQVPGDRALAVFDMALGHVLGVAEIDLGAGRSRGSKRQPAELKPGGGGFRTLADQVESE